MRNYFLTKDYVKIVKFIAISQALIILFQLADQGVILNMIYATEKITGEN